MSLIADVVFASAAVAFAHFGVAYEAPERAEPQAERSVAKVPAKKPQPAAKARAEDCPDKPALHRV